MAATGRNWCGTGTTTTGWEPLVANPLVKKAKGFGAGPADSTLLYDEIVVFDEAKVGLKYALVVERVELGAV